MKNGIHTYYIIEYLKAHESEWLKPDGPLKEVKDKQWHRCGDYFMYSIDPWNPDKYGHKLYRKSSDDKYKVWCDTSETGFYKLENAKRALKRLIRDDGDGIYDSVSPYGKKCQAVRHEFRICKVTLLYNYTKELVHEN